MQELIIFLVFGAALAYLGWRGYRSFFAKKQAGCGKGCGCAADAKMANRADRKMHTQADA